MEYNKLLTVLKDIAEYAVGVFEDALKDAPASSPAAPVAEEKKPAPQPAQEKKEETEKAKRGRKPKEEKPAEKAKQKPAPAAKKEEPKAKAEPDADAEWEEAEPAKEKKKSPYEGKTAVELFKMCRRRGMDVPKEKKAVFYAQKLQEDDEKQQEPDPEYDEEDWTL